MSISRFVNRLFGSSSRENKSELSSPCGRRGLKSNEDPRDMKNKYGCGISLLFTCSSSSRSKPKECPSEKPKKEKKMDEKKGDKKEEPERCKPEKPKGCPPEKPKEQEKPKAPMPFWAPEKLFMKELCRPPYKPIKGLLSEDPYACSPNNPNACSPNNPNRCSPNNPNACSPEKPKETLSWNDWGNENRLEWDERFEAFYDLSAISDHTIYGDYGPAAADNFDALFEDHNPTNIGDQRDVNDNSYEPHSIVSPPKFTDNQQLINKMMENESSNYYGTPNTLALEYLRNQNDTVLELESITDYTSCGQNDNIMINQREIQNEGSDTDYEETFNTARLDTRGISSKTIPARAYTRRTTKIRISREDLQRHFPMTMDDAAKSLDVSRSTLKRICRENDIERWPTRRKGKNINDEQIPNQVKVNLNDKDQTDESTRSGALIISPLRKASSSSNGNVTIKATYGDDIAKFPFSLSSGLNDLKDKVCQRLELNIPIKLKCMDDDGDLIVISCNDALQELFGKILSRSGDCSNTTFDFTVFPITN